MPKKKRHISRPVKFVDMAVIADTTAHAHMQPER